MDNLKSTSGQFQIPSVHCFSASFHPWKGRVNVNWERRDVLCMLKCLWNLIFFLTNSRECYSHKYQMHISPKYVCVLHIYVCMLVWTQKFCFKFPTGITDPAGICSASVVSETKCTWPGGLQEALNLPEAPTRAPGPAQKMILRPLLFTERRTSGSEHNSNLIYISLSFPTASGSPKFNLNFLSHWDTWLKSEESHLLIWQVFTELLLCTGHCSRQLGYIPAFTVIICRGGRW